ncbi:hypothetical protein BDF22DRAFT_700889 [Syncephalis plumigaleata]|nr:hypothetical protein BDF22DRAFT_700889 [Syncephalis plumigaleata]
MASQRPQLRGTNVLTADERERFVQRQLDSLERDNYTERADTVIVSENARLSRRSKGKMTALMKGRWTLAALITDSRIDRLPVDVPTYLTAAVGPSAQPPRKFCSVCGFVAGYLCTRCGMRYCKLSCLETHKETRCMKFII